MVEERFGEYDHSVWLFIEDVLEALLLLARTLLGNEVIQLGLPVVMDGEQADQQLEKGPSERSRRK